MREAYCEGIFTQEVHKAGGIAIKLTPTVAGVPDRMVLWPDGRTDLVELKTLTGSLRPAQKVWHSRAGDLGHPVTILRGTAEIRDWCRRTREAVVDDTIRDIWDSTEDREGFVALLLSPESGLRVTPRD